MTWRVVYYAILTVPAQIMGLGLALAALAWAVHTHFR